MSDDIIMGGWDIAFAMRYGDINAKIASIVAADRTAKGDKADFPDKLSFSQTNALGNTTSVDAKVPDAWRLVSGGDGGNIVIGIELTNLAVKIPNPAGGVDVSGVNATVNVKTKLAGQADGSFKIVQRNSAGLTDITYNYDLSTGQLDATAQTTVSTTINAWVKSHIDSFSVIVSKIDTSLATKNKEWSWLVPKASEAIVVEVAGRKEEDQMLVIRSMTTSTNAPVVANLSGKLIPDATVKKDNKGKVLSTSAKPTVGIAINPSLFLEKMIKPVLPVLFDGASDSDFRVAGSTILTSRTFTIANFKPAVDDNTTVKAEFSNFRVELVGDVVEFSSEIKFPYKSVVLTTTYRSRLALEKEVRKVDIVDDQGKKTGKKRDVAWPKAVVKTVAAQDTVVKASASLQLSSYIIGAAVVVAGAVFSAASVAAGDEDAPAAGTPVLNNGENDVPLSGIEQDNPPQIDDDDAEINDPLENPGKPRKLAFGKTYKYWGKTFGVGMFSLLAGGGLSSIPTIIKNEQEGTAEAVDNDLNDFLEGALKVVSFPEGPGDDYELVNIQLSGTLVLGARLKGT